MIDELNTLLEPYQIKCNGKQLEQFQLFYHLLLEWNQKMNLTSIIDPEEVLIKHFFDSITPSFYFSFQQQKMIDIGAGAGFPSIPLKICFPDLELTMLDSLKKRITFLDHVSEKLRLSKIKAIHGRAEEIGHNNQFRQHFDIAISRAVARLNVLSELSLPFIKIGGSMIALKGAIAIEELKEADHAIKILGGSEIKDHFFQLPKEYGERTIIILTKGKTTPNQYPRKPGVPNRQPIK